MDVPSFAEATRVERLADGRYRARLPTGWEQGRGLFGGAVVGVMIRAIEEAAGEPDRPVRAVSAEIPSPVTAGDAELTVTTLRRGSGVSCLEVHLRQAGETRARASAVLGKARPVEIAIDLPPPAFEPGVPLSSTRLPPAFARQIEFRPVGAPPFSGADEPVVEGWVRWATPLGRVGVPELAGLIDAYWPAFFPTLAAPRPGATVSFPLYLTPHAHAVAADGPLYHRARVLHAADGFLLERRELWAPDGRLLAVNPQTFTIIA